MRQLADEIYPKAEKIVRVMDNLNTHTKALLYEAFEPAEAKRIADKLEIHYTYLYFTLQFNRGSVLRCD